MAMTMSIGVEFVMKDSLSGPATKIATAFQTLWQSVRGLPAMSGQFNAFSSQVQQGVGGMVRGRGGGGGGGGLAALQGVVGGVAASFVALKGVTAAFSAFDGLTQAAGKFGITLASAGAITRASAADMKMLEEAAIKAGIETQFSPIEAVQGLELLGQSGYNAAESTKLLIPTLDLAAGGQISVAQAAATASAAVKVFGLSIDQASVATDKLLRISNATSLKASDLQIALGNVSRGAIVTRQSIDEMLPSIGLVKNAGVQASVASSSVSSALLNMAKNADKFKAIGVSVSDSTGKFRPFMDVVRDTEGALAKKFPNAADRSAKALELFSKFGLTAYSAMTSQLGTGIVDAAGKLVKGQEAIDFLRRSMETAGGAAAEFRSRLLDTFEGQKTLLKGSIETLMVVVGKPLTAALRPFVEVTINAVNRVIAFVQGMPDGMKVAIAKVAILFSVLGSVASAALAFGVAIAAIAPYVATLGSAISSALPVLAAVGVVLSGAGLAAAAFGVAYRDLDGVFEFVTDKVNKAKLAFDALVQLFTSGEIRGDTVTKLLDPANAGVLDFVKGIYTAGTRLMNFFDGLKAGFTETISGGEETFNRLMDAVDGLLNAFGLMFGAMDPSATKAAFNEAGKDGYSFGQKIADIALIVVDAITWTIEVITGMVQTWRQLKAAMSPITDGFAEIGNTIMEIVGDFNAFGDSADGNGSKAVAFGQYVIGVISALAGVVGGAFGFIKAQITGFANIFGGVAEMITGLVRGDMSMVWRGWKRVIFGEIQLVVGMVLSMVEVVAGAVDTLASLVGQDLGAAKAVRGFKESIISAAKDGLGLNNPVTMEVVQKQQRGFLPAPEDQLFATNTAMMGDMAAPEEQLFATTAAANVPVTSPAEAQAAGAAASSEAMASGLEAVRSEIANQGKKPLQVRVDANLVLPDGQVLASMSQDAQASADDLSYR